MKLLANEFVESSTRHVRGKFFNNREARGHLWFSRNEMNVHTLTVSLIVLWTSVQERYCHRFLSSAKWS